VLLRKPVRYFFWRCGSRRIKKISSLQLLEFVPLR
jgi:hypothetical protein